LANAWVHLSVWTAILVRDVPYGTFQLVFFEFFKDMDGVAACGVGICFNKYLGENSEKILVRISCEHMRFFGF
jgi:hypothetical protein